jgi:hypothetical protein
MAIIVEDGSNVSGANSYVTTTELDTYATARGVTIGAGVREQWLTLAMDYFEALAFKGIKTQKLQSLQWPRLMVYIDGYPVNGTEIPKEVKNVQMQIAMSMFSGYSPNAIIELKVKRQKVGDLEVEYMDSSASNPIDPKISEMLRKLVDGSTGSRSFRVGKA